MKNKFVSMLLAIMMVVGLVPGFTITARAADGITWDGSTVATAYAGGTGTEADPYIIKTAGQLIYFRNQVNGGQAYNEKYFRLDADLDMAGKTFGAAIGTNPNYSTSRYFNGHFDGNNHKISNLTIESNRNGYSALFGNVGFNGQEVVIKDLTLVNVMVNRTDTNYGAAALVGQPRYARIENCIVESGTITSAAYYAGGLVASLNTSGTSGLTIINCVNKADVKNTSTDSTPYTGGILGSGSGAKITGCINYGTITTNKYYVGGIAGKANKSMIEKCANYGTVASAQGSAAGILADGSNEVVKNCYNQGNITAGKNAIGITGLFGSTSGHTDTIENCYSIGTLNGTEYSHAISKRGSYPNACTLKNNYSLTAGDAYVTQKTAGEFADGTVYELLQGANTEQVWGQTIGTDRYPVFYNGSNIPQQTVAVNGVTLDKEAISLNVGGTETLTATVAPTDATNKNVTWSSDAESVATVTDGVVTAVASGSATITVTTQNGSKIATCIVTVLGSHVHAWNSYTGTCGEGECDQTHFTHDAYEWSDGKCSVCGVRGGYCGFAESTSVEYVLTSEDSGSTYTLTIYGYGAMDEYLDYTDSDNPPWYGLRTSITTVEIRNGVLDIGWGAFKYHTALQSVTIPISVTEIKRAAFLGATSLTSISLPSSVASIGQSAFKESGLTSISIPSGVTKIQGSTFSGCTKLETVTLPNSITEIEGNAFQRCTALSSINIPNNVTGIGEWAFNQSGLTSVTIPTSVTTMGMHAFSGCPNLKTVTINGTNLAIAERAFQGDEALETLIINNTGNVTIGDYAFMIEVAEGDDDNVDIGDVGIGGWTPANDEQIETQSYINSRSTVKYTSQSETGESGKDKLYTITLPDTVTYNTDYATSFKNRVRAVDIGDTATVLVGNSIKASPAFTSDTAFDETLTWSTSNSEVATVDANGKVTGVSAGSATITATSKYKLNDVFRADTCVVTVKQHTHAWIYSVNDAKDIITAACSNTDNNCPNANGGSVSIALPDSVEYTSYAIEAKVTDNMIPEHTVVYSGDGLLAGKPVNPGTYTATITLGSAEISVSYTITNVLNGIMVTADPTGDVAVPAKGNTQNITLTATADYTYGDDADVTAATTWSLADTYNGVTINNNVITIAPEAAVGSISVKAKYNDKEQTSIISLTKEGAGELYALGEITGLDSVSVNGATTDQTATYTISGEDKYGAFVTPTVEWNVAGMDGVSIDENGILTVPKDAPAGTVTITATAGSLSKTKLVSITAHEHSWTYAANGDTLTATCGNTGCLSTNTELKINAPALHVYGDIANKEATLSATSIGGITTLSEIQYDQKNGEGWTVLSGEPDVPGSYRASITVDTATASVEYTIDRATLTASGTGSASGTYGAKLSELTVSGLTALLNGTEVPGTWTLTGDAVPNVGDTESYTATFTPAANAAYYKPLTAQVTLNIAPAKHNAPTAVVGSYAPNANKTAFVYTIFEPTGNAYEYSTNGTDWQDSPIFAGFNASDFDGFNAGDKATFYARVEADSNHTASDSAHTGEVEFTKLDQEAPALSYQVSGNSGNRTITITEVESAEYSFDGGNTWGSSNVLTGINDETVSIAIRMKETAVYKASEKVSASVNTAKQVQTVTFDTTDRTATYGDGTLEAREASAEGAITYESSDTTVATVDEKGVVTIVGAGTATITAKAAETETHAAAQASYRLTVNPKALTAEGITLTLTESLYQYDGTAKTPVVLLKDGNTVLEADRDYQVKDGSTTTASAIAVYTITLSGTGNYTGDISEEWEITRIAAPAAPQNLQGVAPTTGLVDDGKIIGTTDEMEYAAKADFSDAKDCGEGETTNLAPGTYYVRLKGTDTTEPGAAAVVNVPAYSAPIITFDANGGTVVIASVATEQDGTLAGLPTATRSGYTFNGWFTAKTGGTQVTADTFFSVSTTIYAQWTYIPVPPIIESPAADTIVEVYEGQTAQMTVVSQNATSYQWFINRNDGAGFVEYEGSTLATHTTAAVKPENDGFRYYCLVTNTDGSVRSHVFTLRVLEQIELPQTGDNSQIGLWLAMCFISIAGMIAITMHGKKKRTE